MEGGEEGHNRRQIPISHFFCVVWGIRVLLFRHASGIHLVSDGEGNEADVVEGMETKLGEGMEPGAVRATSPKSSRA
jgi:hypothetical protein